MRKGETTNSFQKGMVMDLNPLVTPNDVLTNCLNGTIVTFNGNEYVLQNDMGNGRVESAYLPKGYIPVGIKEHGGIIYVASCNPLNNKCQIGSFPSPERNISSSEKDTSGKDGDPLKIEWNPNLYDDLIERYQLFKDSTVIRSGDKFSIIFQTDDSREDLSKLISNLDNITGSKIKSPKNKFMTISVCVLDSSNNLLDITDQLLRLDENSNIINSTSDVPEIRFNTGYFAEFVKDLDDKDLAAYRKQKAVNIYNNKLFGELFIQAKINAIDNIDVTVDGIRNKSSENQALSNFIDVTNKNYILDEVPKDDSDNYQLPGKSTLLMFEITYEYNCPDGYYKESSTSDLYVSDYGSEEDFKYGSDTSYSNAIRGCELTIGSDTWTLLFKPSETDNKPVFDYNTKTYKYTAVYGIVVNSTQGILNYKVTPVLNYQANSINIKQESIAVSDDINLDAIGSGQASLEGFKYYWTNTNIDLSYKVNIYPRYGKRIGGIGIHIYDLIACGQNSNTSIYDTIELASRNSYNGTLNENIPTSKFKERGIYLFKFYYISVDKNANPEPGEEIEIGSRVFINSAIFNQEYFTLNDFVPDILMKDSHEKISIHSNIDYTSSSFIADSKVDGVLMKNTGGENTYTQAYLYNTEFNINNNLYIDHPQYYPFTFNADAYTSKHSLSDFNADADITVYNSQENGFKESLLNFQEINNIIVGNTPQYQIDGTSLKINTISKIQGPLTQKSLNISSKLEPFINEQDGMYLFGQGGELNYVSKFIGFEISHNLFQGGNQTDGHFYSYSRLRTTATSDGVQNQIHHYYRSDQQAVVPIGLYTGINRSDASYTDLLLNTFGSSIFAFMCNNYMYSGISYRAEGDNTGNWVYIYGCVNPNFRNKSNLEIGSNISTYLLKRWQLVWWRTTSGQYALIPYVYYFKSNVSDSDFQEDVVKIIKDSLSSIYLLQNSSSSTVAYTFEPTTTQYNDTYDLTIKLNVNTQLQESGQSALTIGDASYNAIIDNAAKQFSQDNVLISAYKFQVNTSNIVTPINYTIRVNGTNETYINQKAMEASSLERVFVRSDGSILTTDLTGMQFNYGKIYKLGDSGMEDQTTKFQSLKAMEYNGKYTLLAIPNRSINNTKFMIGQERTSTSPVFSVTLEDSPATDINFIYPQPTDHIDYIQLDN